MSMAMDTEGAQDGRNLGRQPLAGIMDERGLSAHDLVAASETPVTHKLFARAAKGRRLTRHSAELVLAALNRAASAQFSLSDLFTYEP